VVFAIANQDSGTDRQMQRCKFPVDELFLPLGGGWQRR